MLSVTSAQIAAWLGEFFWPFLRTLALFAAAPAFGSTVIPARIKVALAVLIAILIGGIINQPAPLDLSWASAVLVVEQILVGLAMGFAMQLTLAAMAFAGDFVGIQMGFGFATLFDFQSGFEVPVMSNFFSLVGLILFLTLNGHLILLGALVRSFQIVPVAVGTGIPIVGWQTLVGAGSVLFQMGVWLALPVIAVLMASHLAVAVISRVAPQINVMSVGFSVFLWVGLAATVALVPYFVPAVQHMITAGLTLAGAVVSGR